MGKFSSKSKHVSTARPLGTRPLGTKATKRIKQQQRDAHESHTVGTSPHDLSGSTTSDSFVNDSQKIVDNIDRAPVDSSQIRSQAMTLASNDQLVAQQERHIMDITLTRDSKPRKSTAIVYASQGFNVRLPKSAFVGGNPPETLSISSDAFAEPRVPKAKLTKEQRAELRKNAPKPTLAEKIAKREAALAKLKAQLAEPVGAM